MEKSEHRFTTILESKLEINVREKVRRRLLSIAQGEYNFEVLVSKV
jgi:hypothetical protein